MRVRAKVGFRLGSGRVIRPGDVFELTKSREVKFEGGHCVQFGLDLPRSYYDVLPDPAPQPAPAASQPAAAPVSPVAAADPTPAPAASQPAAAPVSPVAAADPTPAPAATEPAAGTPTTESPSTTATTSTTTMATVRKPRDASKEKTT